MENYSYSSYPDSGDSSPRSREIECETAVTAAAWDELPPPCSRVKLMCSYGGRIQPRSHDNQLSYVGGDTKILAVDRSIRYSSFITRLFALSSADDVIIKYQLPGEDLDALISVTNDEDLEHMMLEYDRLHRTGAKQVQRLRLFLFVATGKLGEKCSSFNGSPPAAVKTEGPDYLFGLEAPSYLPETKDPARSEAEAVVPPAAEVQVSVQEMQRLQIAEKQKQMSTIQRNESEESLSRLHPVDYYPLQVLEKPPQAAAPTPDPVAAYWPDQHRSVAPTARFASFVGGDGNFYLVPASPGVFQANAPPGQAFYTTVQRMMPPPSPAAYDSTAYPPPQANVAASAYDNGARAQAVEVSAGYAAYDSAGRPVYYTGAGPTYQTVNNAAAIAAESKVLKPSQVS